jgi:S1-C subfamily serine protease
MLTEYTAILEQLTGARRGAEVRLHEDIIFGILENNRILRFVGKQDVADDSDIFTILRRTDESYSISVINDREFWINRRLVNSANLRDGDVLEFGETGPMMRYYQFTGSLPLRWTIAEMAGDSVAYLRFSRTPLGYRLGHAAAQFGGRLIRQTTITYRVTIIVALIALAGFAYSQYQASLLMRERIEASSGQLDSVAAALAKARAEALKPSDLVELRKELTSKVSSNVERLNELERHSGAVKRVIREATESVAFLQLEFRLRDALTGQEMRHVLNRDGVPVMLSRGQPLLALDGNGPVAKIQLTGTGFLLQRDRWIATNRHVAMPWEYGRYSNVINTNVFEPVVTRFVAYFPNHSEAVGVSLVNASQTADLALLKLDADLPEIDGLELAERASEPGEEVILLGYPTGLRSLLAQSGEEFVRQLQVDEDIEFWNVSKRLSEAGLIVPLASRGITAQVASEAIVYDAETTMGGSGGPVLNLQGEVIGINAAILPEFGGSNLGVPVAKLKLLIAADAGGIKVDLPNE